MLRTVNCWVSGHVSSTPPMTRTIQTSPHACSPPMSRSAAALEKKDFVAALTRFSGAPHGMESFVSAYTSVWGAIALLPAAGYGVVFGADKTPQSAMDEVRKALSPPISAQPALLYNRQGFWRPVAFFGTQDAAAKRLADFKGVWPEAYVVAISSWCPTPKLVSPETKDMAEQKDCQF